MAKEPKPKKPKLPELDPPKSLIEVASMQIRMAELLGAVSLAESSLEAAYAQLKEHAIEEVKNFQQQILQLAKAIEKYAEAHKEELTTDSQTVPVPMGGSFQWYDTPLSVRIKKDDIPKIIKRIKRKRLKRFIRTSETIDKEAMLKEPAVAQSIPGVKIDRDKKFVIRPPSRDERVEHNLSTGKRQICLTKKEGMDETEETEAEAA